jgi:hypothetical protein
MPHKATLTIAKAEAARKLAAPYTLRLASTQRGQQGLDRVR